MGTELSRVRENTAYRNQHYRLKREGGVLEAEFGKLGIPFFDGMVPWGNPGKGSFLVLGTSAPPGRPQQDRANPLSGSTLQQLGGSRRLGGLRNPFPASILGLLRL